MIRIEAITSRSSLRRFDREWSEVLAASRSDTFSAAHGWLMAWSETVGRGRDLLVLRVRKGSETIGFVPLMFGAAGRSSILSYRTLHFAPDQYLAATTDLIVTGDRQEAVPAVLEYLSRRLVCAELELEGIPVDSPNLEILRGYAADRRERCDLSPTQETYHVEIGSRTWEEYLQTTSRSFVRKDIARLRNRYGERDWAIRDFGADRLEELLPTLARLHAKSQGRHGRGSCYQDIDFLELLRAAARDPKFGPSLRTFVLEIDGVTAAFELGFQYGDRFYGWDSGFDPDFDRLSPSKFLMYKILEQGFRERWRGYDVGRGSEYYKQFWGCERRDLYRFRWTNGWGLNASLKRIRNGGRAFVRSQG